MSNKRLSDLPLVTSTTPGDKLAIDGTTTRSIAVEDLLADNLVAIQGLTSAADKGIQFTGAGTASTYDLTAAGKALLDDASAAAQRTTLGLAIGTDVQAYDADLAALAALSGTNTMYYRSGANTWSAVTVGSNLTFSGGTLAASGGGGSSVAATVRVATTGNVNLASALENGDTIDGITLATGNAVLVWQQTAPAENGIYAVPASGAASRASSFAAFNDNCGAIISVQQGSLYADKMFLGTANAGGTLGTTAVTFTDQTTPAASTSAPGIVELATSSEADAYTDSTRAVTPQLVARTGRTFQPTIADDTVYAIPVTPSAFTGMGMVMSNISNTYAVFFASNVGSNSMGATPAGTSVNTTTGTLTGTTGTDGKYSISIDANNIYIENRLGGSVQFTVTVFGR